MGWVAVDLGLGAANLSATAGREPTVNGGAFSFKWAREINMRWWNRACLESYRIASQPLRWLRLRSQQATGKVPLVVLYYHRVADVDPTPWTISRSDFAAQLDWLQAHVELISLTEVYDRLSRGWNERPAVAITFDDGYAENMDFALPLLVQREIPCLYYVSSAHVFNQVHFQHDRRLGLRLPPNSVCDLQQMAKWGIEIGSHTRTHADLGSVQHRSQFFEEMVGSRRELTQRLGVDIDHFAFPYGQRHNISATAIAWAKRAGYKTVSGAYGGYNAIGGDPFFIQRMHGDPHLHRLKNWVTLDPRWMGIKPAAEWLEADGERFADGRMTVLGQEPALSSGPSAAGCEPPSRSSGVGPITDSASGSPAGAAHGSAFPTDWPAAPVEPWPDSPEAWPTISQR
jgi:peptidoglycan/xylan/chitin deacetylase (PgdA/CDA1 family)